MSTTMRTTMLRSITGAEALGFLARNASRDAAVAARVTMIIDDVRRRGDHALIDFAREYDAIELDSDTLFAATGGTLEPSLAAAVDEAVANVRAFAEAQLIAPWQAEMSGRRLGQVVRPLESVGVYVPAGRYPLLSSMVMAVVPALVAGVPSITIACPRPDPTMLAVAARLGVTRILRAGGAQAIAALAYGTASVDRVRRIVGPGNAYVAEAKRQVAGDVGIDFVAGPSEVMVVADDGDPAWVAADLLAQAEHDPQARAVLLTTSETFATAVCEAVDRQLELLPTRDIAAVAIAENSAAIVCADVDEVMAVVNTVAPEHLCLHDPALLDRVTNAGSVFLGPWSTEALGDYVTGPNHVLPTGGAAAVRGGLSVNDFVKVITVQHLDRAAVHTVASAAVAMARAEGLEAHARSVEVRLDA